MAFANHMHLFDTVQCIASGGKGFQPHHGVRDPNRCPVILQNDVVKVGDLANLGGRHSSAALSRLAVRKKLTV